MRRSARDDLDQVETYTKSMLVVQELGADLIHSPRIMHFYLLAWMRRLICPLEQFHDGK